MTYEIYEIMTFINFNFWVNFPLKILTVSELLSTTDQEKASSTYDFQKRISFHGEIWLKLFLKN